MKAKEVFLIIVAFALLLTTFSIVILTAGYTDNSFNASSPHSGKDIGKATSNGASIHSSADNHSGIVQKAEAKKMLLTASVHPASSRPINTRAEIRPSRYQQTRENRKRSTTSDDPNKYECLEGSQAPDPNEAKHEADPNSIE